MPAPDWVLKDYQGTPYSLSQFRGRPVVVIFYLGYGCLHCAEQLQAFAPMAEKFRQAGISLIAVSTDDRQGLRISLENYEGGIPFPLVADPDKDVFKAYRAYDDFEDMPLHGTFLVDADGLVRWQDISYEPFMDVDFVFEESQRLLSSPVARATSGLVSADGDPVRGESSVHTSRMRTRIEPVGIAGSLIIAGNDVPEEAFERFWDLARGKKARAVVLRTDSDETTRVSTQRLLEHWERKESASIQVLRVESAERARDAGLADALASATAVWIAGTDAERVHRLISETELLPACRRVLQKGGCIGGTAASVPLFTQVRLANRGCDEPDKSGSGLMPDSIIDFLSADEDDESRLPGALKKNPELIGYEIGESAALLVRGRRVRAIGEGHVNIRLAASQSKPANEIALGASRRHADLTALRRSAKDRSIEPFPPTAPGSPTLDNGTLVLVGGGEIPSDVITRFVELAGGPEASIVILPTAIADPIPRRNRMATTFRRAGAKKATVLPGRNLSDVESEEYLETLRQATGICFGGGRQWRFVDAYLDTKAHALMHDLLRRGGVIMGSSAGASIQAEYLARGNPLGNHDIMADGYERGLGFLKGVAVDQHFTQRKRFGDMTMLVEKYPQLLGIGIDESTAIIVQGHVAEVTGRGAAHFFDGNKSYEDEEHGYDSVRAGTRFDLISRTLIDDGGQRQENAVVPFGVR
jgi:cyanophycinase